MVTKEQALTENEFHEGECTRTVGPRGGVRIHQTVWRRNGKTKTWKTRPTEFSIPVKYGLRNHWYITETTTDVHAISECPLSFPPLVYVREEKVFDPVTFNTLEES